MRFDTGEVSPGFDTLSIGRSRHVRNLKYMVCNLTENLAGSSGKRGVSRVNLLIRNAPLIFFTHG